jgi:hypothetical protein
MNETSGGISEALAAFSHINKVFSGNNVGKSSHLKNLYLK